MKTLSLHPMLPRQSREEESRHAFLIDLKNVLSRDMAGLLKDVYEEQAVPEFRKRFQREPQSRHDVGKVMKEQPTYQMWSALSRVQQELYVDSTAACTSRQLPGLRETFHALTDAPKFGTLDLVPGFKVPRYISEVDIHCIPGGYFLELGEDDVYAGARYDIGSFIFGRGERGALNDARGATAVEYLRENLPGFSPRRILDMGCAAGMNTIPYADAFPDAEVIGIDVSAPCLRYAHARAESLEKHVHFAQRNAEDTGYEAGSFDLVVSQIMFHETSRKAAQNIVQECYRLLRPGGWMLHLDVPRRITAKTPYDQFIADWDTMNNNEPFWGTFMFEMDMTGIAHRAGFAPETVQETLAPTPERNFAYWCYVGQKPLTTEAVAG